LHITRIFDLTYFSRSQRSKLQLLNYWVDLHQIFILHTSNKDTSHIARVFHLTYFSRAQRSNLKFYDLLQHLNYQVDLHQIFIMDTSNKDTSHITPVFDLTYFSMSEGKLCFLCFFNTLTIGWIFTKYVCPRSTKLSWGHYVLGWFLPHPRLVLAGALT
jgi:hypothetical protein